MYNPLTHSALTPLHRLMLKVRLRTLGLRILLKRRLLRASGRHVRILLKVAGCRGHAFSALLVLKLLLLRLVPYAQPERPAGGTHSEGRGGELGRGAAEGAKTSTRVPANQGRAAG